MMKSIDLLMNCVCFSRGHKQRVSGTAGSCERWSAPTEPGFIMLPKLTWSPCPVPAMTEVGGWGGGCPGPLQLPEWCREGAQRGQANTARPLPAAPDTTWDRLRQLLLRAVVGMCVWGCAVDTPMYPPLQPEPTGALLLAPACGRGSLPEAGARQLPKPGAAGFQRQLGASEV